MKRFLVVGLLFVLAIISLPAVWPIVSGIADAFEAQGRLEADAGDLKSTRLTPVLETRIEAGTNVVWCGTFQLAWNEVSKLLGEDLHFAGNEPEVVALLNKKSFVKDDLDAASYVALADYVRNDIYGRIRREVAKKFAGRAQAKHLPSPADAPRPQDIVAYAFLFKNLEFNVVFERINRPLEFAGDGVSCFGIDYEYKPKQAAMYKQVEILDYRDRDDFVVELQSKAKEDRLILAKAKPRATLRETIAAIEDRMAHAEPVHASVGDVLLAPKFDFELSRQFRELQGLKLAVANPAVAKDLQITSAMQDIRFQMNEKGVKLQSEAHISIGCAAEAPPKAQHVMVFDKPFLVLLQRAGAKTPYFAMWIDNAELLQRAKK